MVFEEALVVINSKRHCRGYRILEEVFMDVTAILGFF